MMHAVDSIIIKIIRSEESELEYDVLDVIHNVSGANKLEEAEAEWHSH